jgi:hypothetical protein
VRLVVARIVLSFLLLTSVSFGVEYPFTSVDILGGDVTGGDTRYGPSTDTYTVMADGHDIWDSEDDFRFVYVEMAGDFSVSVRVDDPGGSWPHSWSKAGIMVRQDLTPGSKDVYLVATRDSGVAFQWRDQANSPASWTGQSEPPGQITYPIWLQIVRQGHVFTGWYSDDGQSWEHPPQNTHTLVMSNPVLVGICLTSHVSGVLATATFGNFHIPQLEASTVAIAPPHQIVREGDVVLLNGTGSWNATTFHWEQVILGDEPEVAIEVANQPIALFVAPELDVATVLTFRLAAYGSTGGDSATTTVTVKADNAPMVSPANLSAELGNLSVILRWDAILDADCYAVKRAEQLSNGEKSPFQTIRPCVQGTSAKDEFLEEGLTYAYVVVGKNSFAPYEGPPSNEVSITAMRNLALFSDASPIALVTAPTGGGLKNLTAIMNGITEENYDTFDDYATLDEDWFGYTWSEPRYFDHVVYYEGQHFDDGGWWTNLTVQVTEDGLTWEEVPGLWTTPSYDFTDSRLGRRSYSRFDLAFKPVRGKAIRIYGSPGGVAGFTSVAELEVYGNQNRGPLTVYGLDRTVDERSTVVLDASHSISTRGPIMSYRWQQTGGPSVIISNPDSALPTFDAPGVDSDILLTFTVTASDGTDEQADEVEILIRNITTQAEAGPDIAVREDTVVELDGTASATTSGELTYEWTQETGPRVILSGADSRCASFVAPSIWKFSEDLRFRLKVNDGLGRYDSVSTDTVTVSVKNGLNAMAHLEKARLVVIEAENYTSINRNNDYRGTWQVFEGQPTYVEVPDIPGLGGTREWEDGAEISYDILLENPGEYHVKLRRFVPHGGGHDGETSNSCRIGVNGTPVIQEFDNQSNFNRWAWAPSDEAEPVTFPESGRYTLNIRCREDGYRIDRILLYQTGAGHVPEDWSDETGPPESFPETGIVCLRDVGTHYVPGTSHPISLHLDVNVREAPDVLILTEYFFHGSTTIVSGAGADTSVPGRLLWTLAGDEVRNRTLTYVLGIPGGASAPAQFAGHLSYGDVLTQEILGPTVLYPAPTPPQLVSVEMLNTAIISWSTSPDDSVVACHVYRSSDGRNWTDISGLWGQSPFVDATIQPGTAYVYKIVAENDAGAQTPLASSPVTVPLTAPSMEVREAEDYNYAGGRFPGGPGAPPAVEASSTDNLAPDVDYFYQSQSRSNSYRPQDQVDIRPGEGSNGWFMGYSTPGDWWRYTFQVPTAGYIKLVYRGATGGSSATIEFFWDEDSVGKIDCNTPGGWRDWTSFSLPPFFSGEGEHVLRMKLVSGSADYDLLALGYNWEEQGRKVIFGDDFTTYSVTSEVQSAGGWTIISASSSPGSWRLWNTQGNPLTSIPDQPGPDLPGMTGNYMVSNGDAVPGVFLDEQLVSPVINCHGYEAVSVEFCAHINVHEEDEEGDLQTTDFDISVYDPDSDAWSDWITVFTRDRSFGDLSSTKPLSFDIAALADGNKIRCRWRFYNTRFDFWWAVDRVVVSGKRVTSKAASLEVRADGEVRLSWDRFGTGYYTVQYSDDLTSGSWAIVEGTTWPIIATAWTDVLPPEQPMRFYRVVSE